MTFLKTPEAYAAALIASYMFPGSNRVEMVIEAAKAYPNMPTEYLVAVFDEINKQLDA